MARVEQETLTLYIISTHLHCQECLLLLTNCHSLFFELTLGILHLIKADMYVCEKSVYPVEYLLTKGLDFSLPGALVHKCVPLQNFSN